jgi:hypothetical protein
VGSDVHVIVHVGAPSHTHHEQHRGAEQEEHDRREGHVGDVRHGQAAVAEVDVHHVGRARPDELPLAVEPGSVGGAA